MSIKIKCKVYFRKKFGQQLSKDDLLGYRNILKLLYHKKAETPLKDPDSPKYFISVPDLHLDLIIDATKGEIINTTQIYPLEFNKIVFERAISVIKKEVSKQRNELEFKIKDKKQTILKNIYNTIK